MSKPNTHYSILFNAISSENLQNVIYALEPTLKAYREIPTEERKNIVLETIDAVLLSQRYPLAVYVWENIFPELPLAEKVLRKAFDAIDRLPLNEKPLAVFNLWKAKPDSQLPDVEIFKKLFTALDEMPKEQLYGMAMDIWEESPSFFGVLEDRLLEKALKGIDALPKEEHYHAASKIVSRSDDGSPHRGTALEKAFDSVEYIPESQQYYALVNLCEWMPKGHPLKAPAEIRRDAMAPEDVKAPMDASAFTQRLQALINI